MKRTVRTLATIVQITGALLVLYSAFYVMRAQYFQWQQRQALSAARVGNQSPAYPQSMPPSSQLDLAPLRPARGSVIGWIEIPRLKVSSVVLEGDTESEFQLGAGHVPGTAGPGEHGNVVIAAHRDTFFRNLRNIAPDDRIVITTPNGVFEYAVERTEITDPKNVSVMQPRGQPELTLVTCYPFNYIGSAPDRFIVHAKKVDPPSPAS